MAWNPFGVLLEIEASGKNVKRISATQFTVDVTASWETYYSGAKTLYGMTAASGGKTETLNSFGTSSSGGSKTFTGTYSISGNGSASKTITVTFKNFNNDNGKSASKNLTFNVSVPAWTSYAVSYNANGGTGAPGKQTKWKDQTLVLSSTKPTQSGYTFGSWNTASAGTGTKYNPGGNYTANASATLYAQWTPNTYTVKFNSNTTDTVTNMPSNQTKTYGVTLALSNKIPVRTGYVFKGWGTSASATSIAYSPGGAYSTNAKLDLYAIWEVGYNKPRITNVSLCRVNKISAGNYEISDDGTYIRVEATWSCDGTNPTISFSRKISTDTTWLDTASVSINTSGTDSWVLTGSTVDPEDTYDVKIIITDSGGSSTYMGLLSSKNFIIDIKAQGKGAAVGKTAELEDVFDIGFQTRFFGGILPPVLEPDTDLNDVRTPNTYVGANISDNNYTNCPAADGTFTLIVESCGEEGQVRQTYINCSKYKPQRFVRFYYGSTWCDWLWAGTEEYVLYSNDSGSNGEITLNANVGHYRYIEIYFTDNNGKSGGYTKVYSPQGKTVCLHIQEGSSTIYSRQTMYTMSGTTMKPDTTNASYVRFSGTTSTTSVGTNYIKIVRVIGRA